MATQEQFAAVMQQHAQLLATVHQLAQMQQAQQAAAGTALPSGSEQAGLHSVRVSDLKHLKYTTFDGTPSKYDDWAFNLKRAIRLAESDACKLLLHVERATNEVPRDHMDALFEGLRMKNVSAEMYDLLCQACAADGIVLHTCG